MNSGGANAAISRNTAIFTGMSGEKIVIPTNHRCEAMFIARVIHVIVITGVTFESSRQREEFVRRAIDAVIEPVAGLSNATKTFVREKVRLMEKNTLVPSCYKTKTEKLLLIWYYFLNDLIEREYVNLREGSHLAEISDYLFSLINLEDEVTQKRMVSAKKQARHWMEILQSKGYFVYNNHAEKAVN